MTDRPPSILADDVSPHGNASVLVESDGATIYMYLFMPVSSDTPARACWIRNLQPAPVSFDRERMTRGEAPMLARDQCAHPDGAPLPDPEDLRFVWFEEGDGVALLEGDEVLAIVPFWRGVDFPGYARDCVAESNLCWPLDPDNILLQRIPAAEDYWRWWDANPWPSFQTSAMASIGARLGGTHRYFAIDGGEWPPKALVLSEGEVTTLVTLGVALRAQPVESGESDNPRRIELAFSSESSMVEPTRVAQYLSAQANLPWSQVTFLGHDHTVPCDAFPGSDFEYVLLRENPPVVPDIRFDPVRGDGVRLLWLIPITGAEKDFAVKNGSDALATRLWKAGASGVFGARKSVVTSGLLGFFRRG